MKTMKTINSIIITICALLLGALCFYSCDEPSIGLGDKLNIEPPTVTIKTPDFMENIMGELQITGTAADNNEVVFLSVTVQRITTSGQEWIQEWRSERGVWKRSINDSDSWEVIGKDVTWSIQKDRKKANVEWSIAMSVKDAPNGEYLITAGAENNVKNKGPLQQRRVIIDNDGPVVTVLEPVLQLDTVENTFALFDTYGLEDPAVLDKLHNKKIKIQYKIEDDFSIETLSFQLMDHEGNIFNVKSIQPNWSGNFDIFKDDIKYPEGHPKAGNPIGYLGKNKGDGQYLQVISKATDKAGNEEIYNHGWLVYWPDADKPWVSKVEYENEDDAKKSPVTPGSDVQGQAYDNDGLKSVSYKIYKKGSDASYNDYTEDTLLENKPLVEGANPSMSFLWGFKAPTDSGEYMIVINCTDMYETPGDTVTRYFYVQSSAVPTITITHPDDPNESLFGDDSSGKITITGSAGDVSVDGPSKAKMAWINPKNTNSRGDYQKPDYTEWENSGSPYYTDDDDNIIWDLTLGLSSKDDDTKRTNKNFSIDINLFTDLNIGASVPLTAQTFIFWVEGGNGMKVTKTHSVKGDVTPPELTIENIKVTRIGKPDKNYTIADLKNGAMDVLEPGDVITLGGTWGDDSFDFWKQTDKMIFNVDWGDSDISSVLLNSDGTWTASLELEPADVGKGSVYIMASLGDLGGNFTEVSASVKVNTNTPVLMNITSETPDGYYKAGKVIDICLEFNRLVTFSGGTPTLTLSNGGTAAWDLSSNNSSEQKFTYTVSADHDDGKLNVIDINLNGGEWTGEGGKAKTSGDYKNLGNTKDIRTDTTPPLITKIESLSGLAKPDINYYKEGAAIYLLVTFDEPIEFEKGSGSGLTSTRLKLNADMIVPPPSPTYGSSYAIAEPDAGQNTLMFIYTVDLNQNTPFTAAEYSSPLTVSEIILGAGAKITDIAGNDLTNLSTIPTNIPHTKTIYIDTKKPDPPTVTLSNGPGSYIVPQTFKVSGSESALEYSLNTAWIPYNPVEPSIGITLSSAGTYNISARQTDLAGNVSDPSDVQTIIIEKQNPLFVSFGGNSPGTYKTDDTIGIKVNLREPVNVSGGTPELTLKGSLPADEFAEGAATKTISLVSGSGTSTLLFNYDVQNGDNISTLKVDSIDLKGAALTTLGGSVVTLELETFGWAHNLDHYTNIKIDTSLPALNSADLSGTTLTLTFNKAVYKGTGSITLEHQAAPRLAPAVLTKAEYQRYGGDSTLGAYYIKGTNGTNAAGTPDLTEKYILDYNIATNGVKTITVNGITSSTTTQLLIDLASKGAFTVTVPIVSGAVAGSGTSILTVDLSSKYGYVLPVKGVNYTMSFPAGLVQDSQNNQVAEDSVSNLPNPGVNAPFIRVQKEKEKFVADKVALPGGTLTWVTGADISATQIDDTWVQVPAHWLANPVTTADDKSTDKDYEPVPYTKNVPYWAPSDVTRSNTNTTPGVWRQVPAHRLANPTSTTTIADLSANPDYESKGNTNVTYWVKDATISRTDPGDTVNWVNVPAYYEDNPKRTLAPPVAADMDDYVIQLNVGNLNGKIKSVTHDVNTGDYWFRLTYVGPFYRVGSVWYTALPTGVTTEDEFIECIWNIDNGGVYVEVDPDFIAINNTPDTTYITLQNNTRTVYTRIGSGTWAQYSGDVPIPQYWMKYTAPGNGTKIPDATYQALTAADKKGYVRIIVTETRYVQRGTGTWTTATGAGTEAMGAYYVLEGSGTTPWLDDDTYALPATDKTGYVRITRPEEHYAQRGIGVWYNATGTDRAPMQTPYYVKQGTGTWVANATTNHQGNANWVQVTVPAGYVTGVVAEQPFTAGVKIDTQTPDATISYGYNTTTTIPQTGTGNGADRFDGTNKPAIPSVTMPTAVTTDGTATTSTAGFTLGDNTMGTDGYPGYLFGIMAVAAKDADTSPAAYDKLARSVIMFNNINQAANWSGGVTSLTSRATAMDKSLHLWIRGGDGLSGGSLTPGFPLQWSDAAVGGAGLFTGPDTGLKYWISWEVNATAYYHFIAGTTNTLDNTATPAGINNMLADAAKGPLDWGWAKNAWSFQHHRYPLHPGGSMRFTRDTSVVSPATENFEFYNSGFSGSR